MSETGAVMELEAPIEPSTTFSEYAPCDACHVARALWKISGDSGELYLCGHHKNKLEPKLASWAKEILEFSYI
jgi:hypothetical protein